MTVHAEITKSDLISKIMIADLDAWIAKLREKTPLEENELELLCRIVKDILMQEPNVIVPSFILNHLPSLCLLL